MLCKLMKAAWLRPFLFRFIQYFFLVCKYLRFVHLCSPFLGQWGVNSGALGPELKALTTTIPPPRPLYVTFKTIMQLLLYLVGSLLAGNALRYFCSNPTSSTTEVLEVLKGQNVSFRSLDIFPHSILCVPPKMFVSNRFLGVFELAFEGNKQMFFVVF